MNAALGDTTRSRFAAEVVGIFALLVVLYAVSVTVRFQLLQLPGYLLIASASLLINAVAPGAGGTAWQAFFLGYLACLSVVLGVVSSRARAGRR